MKNQDYQVYAIKSLRKNYIYAGLTANLEKRLNQHNQGRSKTTKPYRPFELIYSVNCDSRQMARDKEKYLKSGSGKEFLKSL